MAVGLVAWRSGEGGLKNDPEPIFIRNCAATKIYIFNLFYKTGCNNWFSLTGNSLYFPGRLVA